MYNIYMDWDAKQTLFFIYNVYFAFMLALIK